MHEKPPAKSSNNKKQTNAPRRPPARSNRIVPGRNIGPASSSVIGPTSSNRGQHIVAEVLSGVTDAIYIDRVQLGFLVSLNRDFKIYEKWFVKNVTLEFVPNQPVTVGGTMSMAPDYDPADPMPDSVTTLSESFNFVSGPITRPLVCKMPNLKMPDGQFIRPALFTGPVDNERLVSYGKFAYNAVSSEADGTNLGRLVLHWDMVFAVKQPYNDTTISHYSEGKSIKVECDTSTEVGVCPVTGDTRVNELLQYNLAHTLVDYLDYNTVYGATIDTLTDCTLKTASGKDVREGSRIYYKAPQSHISAAGQAEPSSPNGALLGNLSLGRTFEAGDAITIVRAVQAWIELRNVFKFI